MEYEYIDGKKGFSTLKIFVDGESEFLHDVDDPYEEAKKSLADVQWKQNVLYVFCGCGLGYNVQQALRLLPEFSRILVLEEQHGYKIRNKYTPFRAEIAVERVNYVVVDSIAVAVYYIHSIMAKHLLTDMVLVRFPNLEIVAPELYSEIGNHVSLKVEQANQDLWDFVGENAAMMINNLWYNLPTIVSKTPLTVLKNICQSRVPVIMVASGPSLNNNIIEIKKLQDKVVVIAAGSAVGPLRTAGITPDIVVMCDPFELMARQVLNGVDENVLVAADITADKKIVDSHKNCCFFKDGDFPYGISHLQGEWLDIESINQGPSVVIAALALAEYFRAEPIVIVGLDMGYCCGKKTHAEGVFLDVSQEKYFDDMSERNDISETLPGWQNTTINTTTMLKRVNDFLADWLPRMKNTVINASESGALINGVRHERLSDIAKQVSFNPEIEDIRLAMRSFCGQSDIKKVKKAVAEINGLLPHCEFLLQLINEEAIDEYQALRKIKEMANNRFYMCIHPIVMRECIAVLQGLGRLEGWVEANRIYLQKVRTVAFDMRSTMERTILQLSSVAKMLK